MGDLSVLIAEYLVRNGTIWVRPGATPRPFAAQGILTGHQQFPDDENPDLHAPTSMTRDPAIYYSH